MGQERAARRASHHSCAIRQTPQAIPTTPIPTTRPFGPASYPPRPVAAFAATKAPAHIHFQPLRWDAPVPLLATAIDHASLRRGPSGKRPRPRPGDADWVDAATGAYAMAAQEAYALAGELARAGEKLLAAQPKLRAKGASRVVDLLLGDDAVSPARAAKLARLSDRASRRLFDRLVELGAVRELSGRSNFRLYGL